LSDSRNRVFVPGFRYFRRLFPCAQTEYEFHVCGNYNGSVGVHQSERNEGMHMMASVKISLLAVLVNWTGAAPAAAQDMLARDWSGACTGCHSAGYDSTSFESTGFESTGSDETGRRNAGLIPVIAGMDKVKFVALMLAFRNGTRNSTVMHQLARGLTEEQIDALGDFFASRPPQ
jgi:cytochrome c553